MGAGKTTVMGEASDLLLGRQIRHAAIDLDAISVVGVPESVGRETHFQNVAAIARNCLDAGIETFLLAGAVESAADLTELRQAMRADAVTVARLVAPLEIMAARLRVREPGIRRDEFVDRAGSLNAVLSAAALEDFTLINDRRSVTDVATELLTRAGWI